MTVYLDASVLVSMFVADINTMDAWRLADHNPDCTTSIWAVAEFSSALGVQGRMGRLDAGERHRAEDQFDMWLARRPDPVQPVPEDFVLARQMLRSGRTPLRTPDALHLAICRRVGLELASFDLRMNEAAGEFSVAVI